ncbi:phage major capsid protein [Paenibacillus taichungensis]|uniref:phage major capsid protein n=1 Tax=Paenibacillus taichungensis TaxID=484184 RepID=UPI0038D0BD4A
MTTNRSIIEKATMTLADLASGGRMNEQQFNAFYRRMIAAPTILNSARTVPMNSDSQKIEKIGFGQRILRPGVEGTALTEGQRTKPTTGTIKLNTQEVIAEINISYDTIENNIEGDNIRTTIMNLLADRAALDLEELIINGDTASSDEYLALIDGVRKKVSSHIVDAEGEAIAKEIFKRGIKAVPNQYLRNPADWRYYTNTGVELDWRDSFANRQTSGGDQSLDGGRLVNAYGVPVNGIAMLQPYNVTSPVAYTDVTDAILTHPKNIVVGMNRKLQVEVDKDITRRVFIIVLTAKIDVQLEEEDATAKIIHIKA